MKLFSAARRVPLWLGLILAPVLNPWTSSAAHGDLRLATFDVDATPPVGSRMAYDPVNRLDELTLRCRGIVLVGAGGNIGAGKYIGTEIAYTQGGYETEPRSSNVAPEVEQVLMDGIQRLLEAR